MTIDRRSILKFAGLVPLISAAARVAWAADDIAAEKVDYTLRIATGLVELAPKHIVSTVLYNQQFPGPLLRFTEGRRAIVDIHNDTDTPELVHWHGQMIPSEVDGAAEEGSPFVDQRQNAGPWRADPGQARRARPIPHFKRERWRDPQPGIARSCGSVRPNASRRSSR